MGVYTYDGTPLTVETGSVMDGTRVTNTFRKINHRGYRGGGAYENTLPAFEGSLAQGFSMVESDIMYTSDGIAVLSHDNQVAFNQGTAKISDLTYANLLNYTVGSGNFETTLMTLEDFVVWCKLHEIHPYLEHKVATTQDRVRSNVAIVRQAGMLRNVSWIGRNVADVVAEDEGARVGTWQFDPLTNLDAFLALKTGKNEVFCDYNYSLITQELCEVCLNNGIAVEAWTTGDVTTLRNLAKIGVSGATADGMFNF